MHRKILTTFYVISLAACTSISPAPRQEDPLTPEESDPYVVTTIERNETIHEEHGTAYSELIDRTSNAVLEKDGKKIIMHSFQNNQEEKFWLYTYRDFAFSPSGRYVTFTAIGWEWAIFIIYDLHLQRTVVSMDAPMTWGLTQDEDRFFGCASPGLANGGYGTIISLPEGKTLMNMRPETLTQDDDINIEEIACVRNERLVTFTVTKRNLLEESKSSTTYKVDLETGAIEEQ